MRSANLLILVKGDAPEVQGPNLPTATDCSTKQSKWILSFWINISKFQIIMVWQVGKYQTKENLF